MTVSRLVATFIGATCLAGCLPSDTRPPPAVVLLEVQIPDDLALTTPDPNRPESSVIEFHTDDGWTARIEKLVTSIGEPEVFANEVCSDYASAPYFRLMDLTRPGPQRLGQIYGLHACKVDYTVEVPPVDAVLGAGVSEDDRDFMHSAQVPVSTPDGPRTARGMAVRILGSVSKGDLEVTFDWGFIDRLEWSECQRVVAGEVEPGLPLTSDLSLTVPITVDPRKLFVRGDASLMQLIVDADQVSGNANGVVAVAELAAVKIPESGQTLAEVLRQTGYPSLFVYGGGTQCKLNDPEL
jgi:hypothetical protein